MSTSAKISSQNSMQAPPQEAIDACDGISDGDSCSFKTRDGKTITGTCEQTLQNIFACVPADGPSDEPSDFASDPNQADQFSDTYNHRYASDIAYIANLGIVEGYSDGTYRPDNQINRAEFLKIILESNNTDVSSNESNCFSDVSTEWYAKYICKAKSQGVVNGYPDGSFGPGNNINFVETLKIIFRAYGEKVSDATSEPWYQNYLNEARNKGVWSEDVSGAGDLITRGQMANMIASYIEKDSGNSGSQTTTSSDFGTTIVVDTNQTECFGQSSSMSCPSAGNSYYGQDGNYTGAQPSYTDNGDGTITDNNTGLMWIQDAGDKTQYYDAKDAMSYAGYDDWRIPTIKELYSLMDFSGEDIDPTATSASIPFIDDNVFVFEYGDTSKGDRIIDSQWITTNIYTSAVMQNNAECFFGVNFADGRIKCYPTADTGHNNGYFLRYVRGSTGYGENDFVDNDDETITDNSSDLMWMKKDSGKGMDWKDALNYCEDLSLAGYTDWRLPNAKELQYIVDYSRSPDATDSPAIDPIFDATEITDEMGKKDWGFYWTGTTHKSDHGDGDAVYIGFGECLGEMDGEVMDVHGSGCQRSDPKIGNESDYPSLGNGPQGDARRVFNYVRCVRGATSHSLDSA